MIGSSASSTKKLAVGFGAGILLAASFATAGAIATGQTSSEESATLTADELEPEVVSLEPVDDGIEPVIVELVETEADDSGTDVVELTEVETVVLARTVVELAEIEPEEAEAPDDSDPVVIQLEVAEAQDLESGDVEPADPGPVAPIACTLRGGTIANFLDESLNANGQVEFTVAFSLPAGEYSLSGESADAYEGRELDSQPTEQWFVEFLDADGSVLATSDMTEDVPDFVRNGTWSGPVGNITLPADVESLRVVHATPGSPSQNSVHPVCLSAVAEVVVGAVEIVEEPVEVVREVIEEKPVRVETPEEMPEEMVVNPVVLGVVDIAPVAQSQPANPTFTG